MLGLVVAVVAELVTPLMNLKSTLMLVVVPPFPILKLKITKQPIVLCNILEGLRD